MATVFVEIGGQEMTQEQFEAARLPLEQTIIDLETELHAAYNGGYADGFEDGYVSGFETGYEDAESNYA